VARDVRPDSRHRASTLVSQHHWKVAGQYPCADVQVGVADSGAVQSHPYLALARVGQFKVLDDQLLVFAPADCGYRHFASVQII
jgi:hypothetical protein